MHLFMAFQITWPLEHWAANTAKMAVWQAVAAAGWRGTCGRRALGWSAEGGTEIGLVGGRAGFWVGWWKIWDFVEATWKIDSLAWCINSEDVVQGFLVEIVGGIQFYTCWLSGWVCVKTVWEIDWLTGYINAEDIVQIFLIGVGPGASIGSNFIAYNWVFRDSIDWISLGLRSKFKIELKLVSNVAFETSPKSSLCSLVWLDAGTEISCSRRTLLKEIALSPPDSSNGESSSRPTVTIPKFGPGCSIGAMEFIMWEAGGTKNPWIVRPKPYRPRRWKNKDAISQYPASRGSARRFLADFKSQSIVAGINGVFSLLRATLAFWVAVLNFELPKGRLPLLPSSVLLCGFFAPSHRKADSLH
jgi:hypothetical protein